MPERTDDLALLVDAAEGAGRLAMASFRQPQAVWDKAAGHPVTAADIACDEYLKARLRGQRPDYGWLSEETADDPARLVCDRVWVVDPIDGTRDYLRGRTGWCVSVALVEHGRPVLAALAAPARGQLFVARAGGGTTLNGAAIRVSGLASLDGVRLPIDPPNLTASFWPSPWPGTAVEKPNSLALRLAHVASDAADAWLEGRTVSEWDLAAAALIATEAGATVTDRAGRALAFNQPEPVIHGIAAATPALHAAVRDRLDHALRVFTAARRRAAD